jgi:HEAT repeat protein
MRGRAAPQRHDELGDGMESHFVRRTEPGKTAAAVTSFGPHVGRDPGAEIRTGAQVTQALWQAVRAFAPDAVSESYADAMARLDVALRQYLQTERFLWLHVTPRGFRVHKTLLTDDSRALSARLAADGVVELLFKHGVTRRELERCIEALQAAPAGSVHSSPTRLWDAELRHIVFRCTDEILGGDDARLDLSGRSASWPEGVAATEHDGLVRRFEAALPRLGGRFDPEAWNARVGLGPDDRARLRVLWLDETQTVVERLARRLAALHDREREAVRGGEGLVLLGDVTETLLEQRKFALLRDVVAALQGKDGELAVSEATLEHVIGRLCSERHVRILGTVLEDRDARPDDVAAVHDILQALPGAVDPLCRLLVKLEDMQARRLVCRVLAFVAKEDPQALVQRAAGQPWYLARNVAYVLGRIGSVRVLPLLRRWIAHEDERVRIEVARALGRVHDPDASSLLADMLDDASWRVRQSAVWSLASMREGRVLPRLRALLFEDRGFRARRSEERDDFFRTYGRLANAAAYAELAKHLEQRHFVAVGWQAELRRGAILALGETGRADAVPLLRAHENCRDGRLRAAVEEALQALRHHGAAKLAGDDDWSVAARIAAAPRRELPFRIELAEER